MLAPQTVLQQRYQIIRLLKAGGMGAVYAAHDQRLNSQVAIKQLTIVNPTQQVLQAFAREATLLGNLKHPALPRVTDHFSDEHGQFLVMEYIAGPDLSELLQQRGAPFSVAEVSIIADQVLQALEYLHRQTPPILHRDIKPSNLKQTTDDKIMLLDFGLAKGSVGLHQATLTQQSMFGYTPGYAPIEQIQGTHTNERSDVYALAATLYHLLTNTLPEDALTRATAHIQGQPDPLAPAHRLNPAIPAALSNLLNTSLKLDYQQRPASASELRKAWHAAYRQPITPNPIPQIQAAPVATATSRIHTIPFVSSAGRVTIANSTPVVLPAYEPDLPSIQEVPIQQPVQSHRWQKGLITVLLCLIVIITVIQIDLPSAGKEYLSHNTLLQRSEREIKALNWNPQQELIAAVSHDSAIQFLGVDDLTVNEITRIDEPMKAVDWNQAGEILAVGSEAGKVYLVGTGGMFLRELAGHTAAVTALSWSPDDSLLASASDDQTVILWNTDGTLLTTLTGHSAKVNAVAWSPDSTTLITASDDATIRVWNRDGSYITLINAHQQPITALAWHPDGNIFASGSEDSTIRLWNNELGYIRTLQGHANTITALDWSPDGSTLASASKDYTIQLWNAEGVYHSALRGHTAAVHGLTWSADSSQLASASDDGTVLIWTFE